MAMHNESESTGTDNKMPEHKKWFICFGIIWCVQMLTAVYFCVQKQGFHEDEFYSYYSTSRTYGLAIEDGAWMEHDDYYNEFVVLEGEEFQYGLVKLVQSWDVHPPVYYWVLHTVCSLFPEQFSKWFGLIINLAAFGVSMFLLRILALKVTEKNEKVTWLVCLFYGFTPAVMSGVVFIRMYALLTVFVYLCAILHVKALERYAMKDAAQVKLSFRKFLLPLMLVTYLGFLTQYYYFIFLFFMAAAFCLYMLWKDRSLKNCLCYACSLAAAFLLAYLTYPACLGQMFRGQRGAQATNSFFDLSNTWMRLTFFWDLLDEYVFGKMLPVLLLVVLCLFLYLFRKKNGHVRGNIVSGEKNAAYPLLLVTVLGYFLAVAKTALLLGNTSVRYQMPIYGMAVLLVFTAVADMGKACFAISVLSMKISIKKAQKWLVAVLAFLCLAVNAGGLLSGRVVFLYPEAQKQCVFAKEMAEKDVPVVCIYDAGQSWCVWDCADEFFAYDKIYFASMNDAEPIEDEVLAKSEKIVVYLSNTAEPEEQLRRVQSRNPGLAESELQYRGKYYDVYLLR
ncbi:MAG: glycosyltransferase family 39 protein [Ruminococcus sp.]|nr:glycosyltransferase family 39 protein [Ruminococcus sp.]